MMISIGLLLHLEAEVFPQRFIASTFEQGSFLLYDSRSKFADGKSIKLVKLRLVACRGIGLHGNPKMTQIMCAVAF